MVATKTLGPWNRGLNLTSNRDLSVFLDDNELGEATNVVFTPEGFVQPRPGFKRYKYNFGTYDTIKVIGDLELPNGSTVSFVQTVVENANPDSRVAKVYMVTDKSTCSLIYSPPTGTVFTHVMSYQSTETGHTGVFLFADKPQKSAMNPNLDLSGTWAPISTSFAVPASNKGFIVKDRLFLFDYTNSKMWWSPANFILDFNNVNSGIYGKDSFSEEPIETTIPEDGIRAVEFYNNNFYIFKKSKTYMFTYQVLPGEDGYLRKISDNTGAFDSTMFRDNVVIVNQKGVYRMDGTEFIDLQRQMNFRFEIAIDRPNIIAQDIFITDFNNSILFGFRDVATNPGNPDSYFFVMSGVTGGWSQWDFEYASNIASPGSEQFKAQGASDNTSVLLFHDFTQKYLVYTDYKPGASRPDYHMDGDTTSATVHTNYYIPKVVLKTSANFGDSPVRYVKLFRTYLRFYMSDIPSDQLQTNDPLWTLSINYNSYKFQYDTQPDGNPIFTLHPTDRQLVEVMRVNIPVQSRGGGGYTEVYQRTYQIPIPQQRAKEFVVELQRNYSVVPLPLNLTNPDADRPIKNGYYFLLSAVWVDYQDKQGI